MDVLGRRQTGITILKTQSLHHISFPILMLLLCLCGCVQEQKFPAPTQPVIITHSGDVFNGFALSNPWVLVDTSNRRLTVFSKGKEPVVFEGIALGAAGAGFKQKRGDDKTPIGDFRIIDIRPSAKFKIFIEFDYPTIAYAENGFARGMISKAVLQQIKEAHRKKRQPPQYTVLGGHIGIHGIGNGSKQIHEMADWTAGCIALDNNQISDLANLLETGVFVRVE